MTPALKQQLIQEIAQCWDDPLRFIMLAWPWGVEGGPLARYDAPDTWQKDLCTAIRVGILTGNYRRFAIGSGHGIGKTAMAAMVMIWFLVTRPNPAIVATANTGDQLRLKTWRELSKWHDMMIEPMKSWLEWTATTFRMRERPELWSAVAQTWNIDRAEAFAGTHEDHVLFVTDESSAIPDIINENIEGAMTTPGAMRLSLGNRTRSSGWFSEAFADDMWWARSVSGRDARHTDKTWIAEQIAKWGEGSDFVRVRIDGLEPRRGLTNFIPLDDVTRAMSGENEIIVGEHEPMILGVDVARYGEDSTVMFLRHGRVEIKKEVESGLANTTIARIIVREFVERYAIDAINIDGTGGFGAGVVDILNDIHKVPYVNEVHFSAESPDPECLNMRSYMYLKLRDALSRGMVLQSDSDLLAELVEFGYHHRNKTEKLQLEDKADIKARLGRSPDIADALALTFAVPVLRRSEGTNAYTQDSYV